MSKPVGELPPDPEPSPVERVKVTEDGVSDAYPSKSDLAVDGQNTPSLIFEVPEGVGKKYRSLSPFHRNDLEFAIKDAMSHQAYQLDCVDDESSSQAMTPDDATYEQYFNDSHVMMNHQPLLFYPYAGPMVRGIWSERGLIFQSDEPMTENQRHILLGAVATFVTVVNNQKM